MCSVINLFVSMLSDAARDVVRQSASDLLGSSSGSRRDHSHYSGGTGRSSCHHSRQSPGLQRCHPCRSAPSIICQPSPRTTQLHQQPQQAHRCGTCQQQSQACYGGNGHFRNCCQLHSQGGGGGVGGHFFQQAQQTSCAGMAGSPFGAQQDLPPGGNQLVQLPSQQPQQPQPSQQPLQDPAMSTQQNSTQNSQQSQAQGGNTSAQKPSGGTPANKNGQIRG